MDQPRCHIEIFWSEEDGGYIASVPDLRYCSAFQIFQEGVVPSTEAAKRKTE